MNDHQRELVQSTWEHVLPLSGIAVDRFYAALLQEDPSLRYFVAGRTPDQRRRLKAVVSILVRTLDEPANLPGLLRGIAQRHSGFDLQFAAPETLRNALLRTLGEALGPLYNKEVAGAWAAFHDLIRLLSSEDAQVDEAALSVR